VGAKKGYSKSLL